MLTYVVVAFLHHSISPCFIPIFDSGTLSLLRSRVAFYGSSLVSSTSHWHEPSTLSMAEMFPTLNTHPLDRYVSLELP